MGTASDKQPYLVGYDYGTGGLWGVMLARSENEIAHLYPELAVVHDRPGWMSDEDHTRMCEHAYPSVTSTMEDGSKAADPEWLCVHPQLDEVMVRTDIE